MTLNKNAIGGCCCGGGADCCDDYCAEGSFGRQWGKVCYDIGWGLYETNVRWAGGPSPCLIAGADGDPFQVDVNINTPDGIRVTIGPYEGTIGSQLPNCHAFDVDLTAAAPPPGADSTTTATFTLNGPMPDAFPGDVTELRSPFMAAANPPSYRQGGDGPTTWTNFSAHNGCSVGNNGDVMAPLFLEGAIHVTLESGVLVFRRFYQWDAGPVAQLNFSNARHTQWHAWSATYNDDIADSPTYVLTPDAGRSTPTHADGSVPINNVEVDLAP